MLYAILTRTYLWLYWFVRFRDLAENAFGEVKRFGENELLDWLGYDVLGLHPIDYCYSQYDEF